MLSVLFFIVNKSSWIHLRVVFVIVLIFTPTGVGEIHRLAEWRWLTSTTAPPCSFKYGKFRISITEALQVVIILFMPRKGNGLIHSPSSPIKKTLHPHHHKRRSQPGSLNIAHPWNTSSHCKASAGSRKFEIHIP